jgi:hypothetical protein
MTKLYYPQISLEDYQIFRKFMLPGEFPETHDLWVESIERSKRKDAVECLTEPTRHTLHQFISKQT